MTSQVDVLLQRGNAAQCSDDVGGTESRVQMIQESCCEQNGANVCVGGGGPSRCDAACTLAFIPYYTHCIQSRDSHGIVLPATTDVHVFALLYTQCREHLPANETSVLLSLVHDRESEPTCTIDTSSILTLGEAKAGPPPCETDYSSICEVVISSGLNTCEDNFCAFCDQAHSCDHTCHLPCGDGAAPEPACESDRSHMCDALIAGGLSCETDFCASCGENSGACDHTCELPCDDGGDDGSAGHRLLAEQMFPDVLRPPGTCSWDELDDSTRQISEVCCDGDETRCSGGLPAVCSYDCGKIFVPFLNQCGETLEKLIAYDDSATMEGYHDFQSLCLQLDPATMALAIDGSVCETSGGGAVTSGSSMQVSPEFADALHPTAFDDCFLTPEEIATSQAAMAFATAYRQATSETLGVSADDIILEGISTDGDAEPGCAGGGGGVTSGSTALRVSYTVHCGGSISCEDVTTSLTNLATNSGAGAEYYAAALIEAVNNVGADFGFAIVVVSTPEEIAQTLTEPEHVSIMLPPAPEPCANEDGGACATGEAPEAHQISTAAAAFPFSSAADLDFVGTFLYAVNVGGGATSQGDASFTGDDVDGVTVTAQSHIGSWGGRNDFGDDDGLEDVLQSIRWSGYPNSVTMELTGLEVGTEYKLQMLFTEKCCTRGWDIIVDDWVIYEDFSPQEVEGGINTMGTGAAVSFDFIASSDTIRVVHLGNGGWPDNNPILDGFTLEVDPASDVPPPHELSTAVSAFPFSSAADLDFVGTFLYAVNVGGGSTSQGDASFTGDDVDGVTVTAQSHIGSWGGRNDFGDDDGLEDVLQSIRWSGYPNSVTMELTGLEVGEEYKLQMLFTEKCCTRGWDIIVDDEVIYENFSPQEVEGGINTMGTGAAVTFNFIASSDTIRVVHLGNGGWPDNNPILDGFTLEVDPASSVPDGHGLSTAASAFPFSSAADLDMTGNFMYAVNVGGGATTQGDATFTGDGVDGVTVTAQNHIGSWGGRNDFGGDDGLEDVLQSIRWSGYPNSVTMELTGLEVGTEYKLQMFFTEKCCTRGWDIIVDDWVIYEDFSPQEVEGGINTMGTGAAVSFDFIASSDTIRVVHLGNGGWPDNNPILDGFTLEVDPASDVPPPHSISNAASAFPFSSAADLDMTGNFLYAVNVGGGATTQGDATFTGDNVDPYSSFHTRGVTVTAQNHIGSWGGRNDFGGDDGLEDVLQSIRWSGYPNSVTMELTGLEVGTEYKLQMLFTEKCCTRGWDIIVDDWVIYENFSPQEVEGGINTLTTGAAVSFDFIASSDTIRVVHLGNGGWPDNNPILDGFTLEVDPASSAPTDHVIGDDVEAFPFSSAADLDMTGDFLWAINVGGGATRQGDVTFTDDGIRGVTVAAQNHIGSWGGRNDFGGDDGLEDVLQSIRWSGYPNSVTMSFGGLTPGSDYKVQMLFTEKCCTRGWDVSAGDQLIYTNFSPQEVEGGINTMGTGAALVFTFTAAEDTMVVTHVGNGGWPDNNPILDGFTVEAL
eukprot:SAG31_NODE_334_length_17513_cov_10.799989_5_plen_1508_part_00